MHTSARYGTSATGNRYTRRSASRHSSAPCSTIGRVRFLVTGCAGFIGSTLTDALLAAGHEVVGVDCFTAYYDMAVKRGNLAAALDNDRFTLHEVDLALAPLDPLAHEIDGVFHLAAQAGVRASWGDKFATYTACNVTATQRLLESIVRTGQGTGSLPRVVFASSSSVYGDALACPTREDALPAPVSPYGVTKLAAEHLCSTYHAAFDLPVVSLRFFTVYGPRQRPDMAFHRFIRAMRTGESITVFGDGSQSRDFTFVGDIVTAAISAMDAPGANGVYNLGAGTSATVREVLDLLGRLCGGAPRVEYGERQRGDVTHTGADTSRAVADLGFAPQVALAAGLERQVAWLRSSVRART